MTGNLIHGFLFFFSDKFPPVVLKKVGNQRTGYGSRTAAYGTPEVVKRIFTGQMPATYFNDICYGRKATPRDLSYKSPTTERAEHLWDPKRIERVKARHKIRDIQDARLVGSGPEVIKLFSCSTQLSMKFVLLINLKLLTIAYYSLLNIVEHEHFSAHEYENANYCWHFHIY